MSKILSLVFLIYLFLLVGCNSYKASQEALLSGRYEEALHRSLKYLINNPQGKKSPQFLGILQRAYIGANERDESKIRYLIKEKNPEKLEEIFVLYNDLKERQDLIKPVVRDRMQQQFPMRDYTDDILAVKKDLVGYLYEKSENILNNPNTSIFEYRKVYDDLAYIQKISPNYQNVQELMEKAHFLGTNFVFVALTNHTGNILPITLERELLDFNTYGINNFWTVYQSQRNPNIQYKYQMEIEFTQIDISPEQIQEKEYIKESQVKDGYKYLERKGKLVKDSLGNAIKIDNYKKITCHVFEYRQFKSVRVMAKVYYKDLSNHQIINSYPIESEFVFNHQYATASGDFRALEESFLSMLNARQVRFPSNEQMVYDAGEDLKEKLKSIIKRQKFN